MADDRLHVILRRMLLSDIDSVLELDHLSFPTPWPARTYRWEITNNDRSTMLVVQQGEMPGPSDNGSGLGSWLKQRLAGTRAAAPLLGFAGMWHVAGEAHVSTIGIHPDWRGHKLGELLFWSMVRQAIKRGADQITLEVRASNQVAQSLYHKYGLEVAGRRKGYYRDNGEDAYMMSLHRLDAAYRERVVAYGRELARTLRVTDEVR
jgi:ribosomal-protein-alanine N-acetyltransferase